MKLNRALNIIFDRLKDHKVHIVGGAVRDHLLGRAINDFDITSAATVDEVRKLFKDFEIIELGVEFGIIVVVINGEEFEIATFRKDGKTVDNRHPETVELVDDIREDLARRDFTINALAFDGHDIVDLFHGREDIENKIIRTVGNADERFKEDGLRILRALRFASVLDFNIEEETAKAIHANKELLLHISKERITKEFLKFLNGVRAEELLREFRDVFAVIIKELAETFDFEQFNRFHKFDVFEHTLHTLDNIEELDLVSRLALLFHDIGKVKTLTFDKNGGGHFFGHPNVSVEMAKEIFAKKLRLTKTVEKDVLTLIELHDINIADTKAGIRRLLNKISVENFERLLVIKKHDTLAHNTDLIEIKERLALIERIEEIFKVVITEEAAFKVTDLKINGFDVMAKGIKGKEVGVILHALLDEVIDGKIENNREMLLKALEEKVGE